MKILIVEDESGSRTVLQRFLEPYGKCHIAVDGAEAMECFNRAIGDGAPFDLICLDIRMPKIDGLEVLRRLRKSEQERGIRPLEGTKVIMTTQADEPSDVLGAFKSGCEAYVIKPIDRQTLLREIQKLGLIPSSESL